MRIPTPYETIDSFNTADWAVERGQLIVDSFTAVYPSNLYSYNPPDEDNTDNLGCQAQAQHEEPHRGEKHHYVIGAAEKKDGQGKGRREMIILERRPWAVGSDLPLDPDSLRMVWAMLEYFRQVTADLALDQHRRQHQIPSSLFPDRHVLEGLFRPHPRLIPL